MKKYLIIAVIGIFVLSSCGESTGKNGNESENDTIETTADKQVEEVGKDQADEKTVYFEDYAEIKTKEALTEKYGTENIKNSTEGFAEGTIERQVSTLTDPQNGYVIRYVWGEDNKTLGWLEASEITSYNDDYEVAGKQAIKAKNGLWLGMSLADLRKWNGANFKFSGFGWDFGGGIFAGKGSKLADSPITITLNCSDYSTLPDFAKGDVELYADNERLKNIKITVSNFELYALE